MVPPMHASDRLRQLPRRLRNRLTSHNLSPVARAVLSDGLTYLSPAKLRRMENALSSVQDIPGQFAEFGVALGGSAILIASEAKGRQFHGFDVFGMIPRPTSEKDDTKSKRRYDEIQAGVSSGIDGNLYYGYREDLLSEVNDTFRRYGFSVNQRDISLHKGLFEETWPDTNIDELAFVHVDCDWYDPVAYCLRAVAPVLSPGGVVMIDDYHDYGGCRTAVDEFLREHPMFVFDDGPNPILRRAIDEALTR